MDQSATSLNGTALGEADGKKPKGESDKAILERIQKRRDLAYMAWKDDRERQLEDVLFCDLDNQWPEAEKMKRKAEGRPCLSVDRTNPFIDNLVNEERKNRPSMTVHPLDDGADEDTAEIIQGYFRHVELNSNADIAYDRASEAQKRGGFGFIRVMTDYVNEESFDQDVKIASIPNPFMWYLDPTSTELDGSDAEWAFGEEDFTAEEFERKFPNAEMAGGSASKWETIGSSAPGWISSDGKSARVVEYYEKVRSEVTLCLLSDNRVVEKSKLQDGDVVKKERKSYKTTIMWYKVCANEILERQRVPGKLIPIVPVYGKELIIDGKRTYWGLVRPMKPVQMMVNVGKSSLMETIGLAPKAPWIVDAESIEDYEQKWAEANRVNHAYLPYHSNKDGRTLAPPTRNTMEPAIQAITIATGGFEQDLKGVTNMYDPSLGNRGEADQSGVAITALQNQGQIANYHYADNMKKTIRQVACVVLGMMQEVVDSERLLRIVGIDGNQQLVKVNSQEPTEGPDGIKRVYDLTVGRYDVVLSSGPSYQTKRQENLINLLNFAKIAPQVAMQGGDLIASQMDFPMAKELADRIRPPQFQKKDGQPPIPPEVQHQMQGMAMMNDALVKRVHELSAQLESKQTEADSREKVASINAMATVAAAEIKANLDAFKVEVDRINSVADQLLAHKELALNAMTAQMPQPQAGESAGQTPAAPAALDPTALNAVAGEQ